MSGDFLLDDSIEFADNPEPRCPCVLLLDTSRSMEGEPIAALSAGIRTFRDELVKDSLASRRVEVAVVTFDSTVEVLQDFVTADCFEPPPLRAKGFTVMGTGIFTALNLIFERKILYRANGIAYYRPWVLMITDGEPHGEPDHVIAAAAERIHEEESARRISFFAVGVQNASMSKLARIAVRPPVKLDGLNFNDMFVWLSTSMQSVAQAKMDEQVALPPPGLIFYQ